MNSSGNTSWYTIFFIHQRHCALSETLQQEATTLQIMMNAKLSQQRFWPCHKNGLIKTIPMIPQNLDMTFQVGFPLLWIKAYPGLF